MSGPQLREFRHLRLYLSRKERRGEIGASSALAAAEIDNLEDLVRGHFDRAVFYLRKALRRDAANLTPMSGAERAQAKELLNRLENY